MVFSSVVRETLPREAGQDFGRGIVAQCDPGLGVCASLSVSESLVARSQDVGIYISGGGAGLWNTAVVETGVNPAGQRVGGSGVGILATCDNEVLNCAGIEVVSCRVAASHGAGVMAHGALGSMSQSVVDTVLADPAEGLYGYGVQVSGNTAHQEFDVLRSVIRDAKLAGVLYCFESQGKLSETLVSGSEYCVAKNEGAAPTVGDDNQLSCTEQSEPAWVSLYPLPAPPPTLPLPPPEE
jgi:hypothetical protein